MLTTPESGNGCMWDLTSYAGLFLIAFGAATVLPAQSEFALVALILQNLHPVSLLLLVATAGNVLGAPLEVRRDRHAGQGWALPAAGRRYPWLGSGRNAGARCHLALRLNI